LQEARRFAVEALDRILHIIANGSLKDTEDGLYIETIAQGAIRDSMNYI
jgi:hypothetical protein